MKRITTLVVLGFAALALAASGAADPGHGNGRTTASRIISRTW